MTDGARSGRPSMPPPRTLNLNKLYSSPPRIGFRGGVMDLGVHSLFTSLPLLFLALSPPITFLSIPIFPPYPHSLSII
ncbi:hypothetical protein GEV33_004688 [Tenebrio molitor]|uniref:Uncharacterized protein n=1 Tax=Tenebrio molitor TaxID=7067 RepID=A0A8J6HR17_TENMO|nr:hypothetical protein GEV33_004688 [Tenebrio molitor]